MSGTTPQIVGNGQGQGTFADSRGNNPFPGQLTDADWVRTYNAADSKIYRDKGNSGASRKARESGQTRIDAIARAQQSINKGAGTAAAAPALAPPASSPPAPAIISPQTPDRPLSLPPSRPKRIRPPPPLPQRAPPPPPLQTIVGHSADLTVFSGVIQRATACSHGLASETSLTIERTLDSMASPNKVKKKGIASHKSANTRIGKKKKIPKEKSNGSASDNGNAGGEDMEVDIDSEGSSSSDSKLYCDCRRKDDHGLMIQCEACSEWFHGACYGIESNVLLVVWYCQTCRNINPLLKCSFRKHCRLPGCRDRARAISGELNPFDTDHDKPGKYCSEEHRDLFMENKIKGLPTGPEPSLGGPITQMELATMLYYVKTVGDFKALGAQPVVMQVPADFDFNSIMNEEEKDNISKARIALIEVVRMKGKWGDVKLRLGWIITAVRELRNRSTDHEGCCGYTNMLAVNIEEFDAWMKTPVGMRTFLNQSVEIDSSFCLAVKCKKHDGWMQLQVDEIRLELSNLDWKQMKNVRVEPEIKHWALHRIGLDEFGNKKKPYVPVEVEPKPEGDLSRIDPFEKFGID